VANPKLKDVSPGRSDPSSKVQLAVRRALSSRAWEVSQGKSLIIFRAELGG
jgi:hypothetical protein